jgi:hypothetical protein
MSERIRMHRYTVDAEWSDWQVCEGAYRDCEDEMISSEFEPWEHANFVREAEGHPEEKAEADRKERLGEFLGLVMSTSATEWFQPRLKPEARSEEKAVRVEWKYDPNGLDAHEHAHVTKEPGPELCACGHEKAEHVHGICGRWIDGRLHIDCEKFMPAEGEKR